MTVSGTAEREIIEYELKDANQRIALGNDVYHNILAKMKENNLTIDDISEQWVNDTFKDIWMYI